MARLVGWFAVWTVAAGCRSELRWEPPDPFRPLLRPGLAGCTVTEVTPWGGDGEAVTQTVYDGRGRPLSIAATLGSPSSIAVETLVWEGDCLASRTTERYRTLEERWTCDTAGFPTSYEPRAGLLRSYENIYRGGRLVEIREVVDGRAFVTTHEWSATQLVERRVGAEDDPDGALVETWDWRARRLVAYRRRPEGGVAAGTDFQWRNGRYAGQVQLQNEVPVLEVSYEFDGGPLPVSAVWTPLQSGANQEVTAPLTFDCPD